MALLAEDVIEWTDGGGKVSAATRPLYGRDHVARFFIGLAKKGGAGIQIELRWINSLLSLVVWQGRGCLGVIQFTWAGDQCQYIHYVRNPEKLSALRPLSP
jgi:RNA polymerase sigma-70 factor (ECF subfamily)